MKVIVAHNRYQSATPSGENLVVEAEIALLRRAGVEVVPFIEDSDELIGAPLPVTATAMTGPMLSVRGVHRLRGMLAIHRPDVLHLHNVFPLISPWAVRTAIAAGVPVVQTVHNYRHTCVAGMHRRGDHTCLECPSHHFPWPAIRYGCYRGSHAQSAVMAAGQMMHRRTWRRVNRFLTTSPIMAGLLVAAGVDAERIEWRPTFAEDLGSTPLPPSGGVAFAGRLEQAKGIELLLEAWTPAVAQRWGRLTIAGDGPLAHLVARRARQDPSIQWTGSLDSEGVRRLMRNASVIAIPSLWFEGFPRVAAEAMSIGRPLLMWEGAGFSLLAGSGAGWALDETPKAWTDRLLSLDAAGLREAAVAARSFYQTHCSPAVAVRQLERVYHSFTLESRGA